MTDMLRVHITEGAEIYRRVQRTLEKEKPFPVDFSLTSSWVCRLKRHANPALVIEFAHRWALLMEIKFREFPELRMTAEREQKLCERAQASEWHDEDQSALRDRVAGALYPELEEDDNSDIREMMAAIYRRDELREMIVRAAHEACVGPAGLPLVTNDVVMLAAFYLEEAWRYGKPLHGLLRDDVELLACEMEERQKQERQKPIPLPYMLK